MKRLFQRRFPSYFTGFFIGLAAVMAIIQVKKAVAPDFSEVKDSRAPLSLKVGGKVRLQLGPEPGKILVWGFPTRLAIGKKKTEGHVEMVKSIEYRDLVESETLLDSFAEAGDYELVAQLFVCRQPGEKYCAKIQLEQKIAVGEGPAEVPLAVDLRTVAEKAAAAGVK